MGSQGSENAGGRTFDQPQESGAEGRRRGLPEGVGGGQVKVRAKTPLAVLVLAAVGLGSGYPRALASTTSAPPPDPRLLEELVKDVQHFSDMVADYRGTARQILKRSYRDKLKAINAKYDAQIDLNDHE